MQGNEKNFVIRRGDRGFIKAIILIVIVLALLAYFGFDVKGYIASEGFQGALDKVAEGIRWVWRLIEMPIVWIWNEIVIEILWENIVLVVWEKVRG